MARIDIKGVIVPSDDAWIYDYYDIEHIYPAKVAAAIAEAAGEDLEVEINSSGGDVWAGSEIYTALMSYPGKVTTRIVGIAASAASVIAMAGRPVQISPTAELMIHNVSMYAGGDYRDHRHTAEMLRDYNTTISNAYALKSGMEQNKLLALMNAETWLTPQQALEYGLVDEIMFSQPRLAAAHSGLLPPEVIKKHELELRNTHLTEARFCLQKIQAVQAQLKLKGAKVQNDL